MTLYFIEMGQGVIARPEMRVRTSPLFSCTLITGWSQKTGFGGAYHFPSDQMKHGDVRAAMALWLFYLKPTAIKLLFAGDSSSMGMGTGESDRRRLHSWVTKETRLIPSSGLAVAACMVLTADMQFSADDRGKLHDEFEGEMRDLSGFPPGDYSKLDHILVGTNMN